MKRNIQARSRNILLVEDQGPDITGVYMLSHHLGHSVVVTHDGKQALEAYQKQMFDLVILDWNMPVMSGYEFLCRINKMPARFYQRPLRVVLHTGENISLDQIPDTSKYQVLDIWRKPMSPVEMLYRMKEMRERFGVLA